MKKEYSIKWKSLLTGYTGQGKPTIASKKTVQKECDRLNNEYKNAIKRWVE